jgi:alpha-L-rhamnosidase
VLALHFNLVPDELRANAMNYLVENIVKRKYHLSTGFLGTPYLCHVLSDNGRTDIAYKLLLQKNYPSWLYPVTRGATTIWERWDGIKPDSTFQTVNMNSFNHYAYGAIGDWMYSTVAGIRETEPGYKKIHVKPEPDTALSYANASYNSLYGEIKSGWKREGDHIEVEVTIPPNTEAVIELPYSDKRIETGSGSYKYSYKINN